MLGLLQRIFRQLLRLCYLYNLQRSIGADVTFKILMTFHHLLCFLQVLNVVVCIELSFTIVGVKNLGVWIDAKLLDLIVTWCCLALWTFKVLIIRRFNTQLIWSSLSLVKSSPFLILDVTV